VDTDSTGVPSLDYEPLRVPSYFSHSYRPEDRAVNRFFHDIFWERGFAFTVDPRVGPMSTTRLEMMMRRSACFLAIVTRRDEEPHYRCSPFVVYENGLAVQAQKPRLVLVERNVSGVHFAEPGRSVVFDRNRLRASVEELGARLDQLAAESRPYLNIGNRALGEVGLLLPDTPPYRRVVHTIQRIVHEAGYTPVSLDLTEVDGATAAGRLDRLDFVVVDVGESGVHSHLVPFIQGRFIPSLKLVHHQPGESRPVKIPRLLLDRALETGSTASEVAVWWSEPAELEEKLQRRIDELSTPRREFTSRAEGHSYFLSQGRGAGPVFVSNANPDNALARELVNGLRSYNIRPFHYMYENTIPPGEYWKSVLPRKVAESSIFVPLISQAYWNSPYCREEFDTALELHRQGLLRIFPCFLESTDGPEIEVQGISLSDLDTPHRIERIISHLDHQLLHQAGRTEPTPGGAPAKPAPRVDIAILTALPEEYEAMYERLEDPRPFAGSAALPNQYSWVTGTVTSPTQGAYRVLLALAGAGIEAALLAARTTTDGFRPDSVLLVGVAGAVDDRLHLGDVVVSERVFGYEYGEVHHGFHPRPDLSFPTDQSVASAARTLATRHQAWHLTITTPAPGKSRRRPQVVVGAVASGNKVVDNLGDAAFAPVLELWPGLVAVEMEALGMVRAIDDARERGFIGHFAMIRGISDRPVRAGDPKTRVRQSGQRQRWKAHAAATAAAFTVRLIQTSWPRPPTSAETFAGAA
jgi:nucleoside phosphorylase